MTNSHFIAISAVLAGIKDIRAAIDDAQEALDREGRSTVVFVDEIHSFNKTQQDALLPHVESGLLTLIGGTTEHPGMQVTNALLSRAQVYNLQPLAQDDFNELLRPGAPAPARASRSSRRRCELLGGYADGDARRFLNLLEQVSQRRRRRGPGQRRRGVRGVGDQPVAAARRQERRLVLRADLGASTSRCAARSPTPRCTGSRA